jgi:dolichol-phosphate mannosyltransferase
MVTLDADLQHNPEHIPSFLSALMDYEVVLGSRYIRIDRYFDVPRMRLIINRYICGLLRVLFSIHTTDAFCGYRGYRDSFLRRAFFTQKSYGLALEILLESVDKKAAFSEIPIEAIYFNTPRKFQDGLDDPRSRLSYYLDIISRKRREIGYEKEIFDSSPAS